MTSRRMIQAGTVSLVVVAVAFFVNACSGSKTDSVSAPAGSPAAPAQEDAAASQIVDGMKQSFLPIFCNDGSFFRECYALGATECQAEAGKAIEDCLNPMKAEIAQKVKANASAEEGRAMGQRAGSCSAEKIKERLQARFTNAAKCNDPTQWQ